MSLPGRKIKINGVNYHVSDQGESDRVVLSYVKGELVYKKCQVPTMGIWSAGDTYLWEEQMVGSAEFMEAEWRYESLDEGSHWVMLEKPDEINRLLLDWLNPGNG